MDQQKESIATFKEALALIPDNDFKIRKELEVELIGYLREAGDMGWS